MMFCQAAVTVSDISQIGESRREANRLATKAGLDEDQRGKATIVATELATNLQRYATKGELLMRSYEMGGKAGIELIALDRGPGMPSVARCLEDGYSSGGTPGNGLGAVSRLSNHFEIYSTCPGGTIVWSRIETPATPVTSAKFVWGVINRPAPNETVSGDTWRIAQQDQDISVMVADGLGHGIHAADAANVAAGVFDSHAPCAATEFLAAADLRMRSTRGAAVAIARIDTRSQMLQYAGVGNIAGSIRGPQLTSSKGLVSHNGTVGHGMRRTQTFDYEYEVGSLLIMNSDGLSNRWNFDAYPGLLTRHPAVIAGVLYRDYRRDHDDVTVCVLRTLKTEA